MPISSGGPYEKKNVFHGKLNQHVENSVSKQNNKKFLKIAPALPLLPAVPRPPKLHQRSNTTLSSGVIGNGELDTGSCSAVFLQTNNEGKVQATRSQKERERNPDRISLDRRGLTTVPVLIGETKIRLLSLQHNLITRLDNLQSTGLTRLVFLDIYDNQLDKIAGLEILHNLRVLLMGKNRIRRMEGLKTLVKLEVLDLHGNQIAQIGGLAMLGELKVLNLAGNQIRILGTYDLQGLKSLQELNLRRNRLKRLLGFAETPQLVKLFLSNNELQSVDDMASIVKSAHLREISIDGNPVALGGDCVSFLVSYLHHLQLLSHMQVTEQVRRAAMAWRLNRESTNPPTVNNIETGIQIPQDNKRDEVIYNARTNWELLRSQTSRTFATIRRMSSSLRDIRSDESELDMQESLPLSARAVRIPVRAEIKRAEYSRRRTMSQGIDRPSITQVQQEPPEYFRLPPILTPHASSPEEASKPTEVAETVSSVEPVADSSLSSLPSDTSSGESDVSEEWNAGNNALEPVEVQRNIKSASVSSSSSNQRKTTAGHNYCHAHNHRAQTSKPKAKIGSSPGKIREQGGDYLVEISGRYLNVYGQGALRFIDRPWNPVKAGDVTTVRFNFVNFNNLATVLGRVKQRFPSAEHFLFRDTNIQVLGQLNALADIQGLTSLTILPEGNPIYEKDWRNYAIYRLSHWGLTSINDLQITEDEVRLASEEYEGLSDLVLSSLPDSLLQPLLSRLRIDTAQQSARQWLWAADPALRTVVAKEALQWRRTNMSQEDMAWRQKGRQHLNFLLDQALSAVRKLQMLENQWSDILRQLVRDTLVDYSQLDDYMKRCMSDLKP